MIHNGRVCYDDDCSICLGQVVEGHWTGPTSAEVASGSVSYWEGLDGFDEDDWDGRGMHVIYLGSPRGDAGWHDPIG